MVSESPALSRLFEPRGIAIIGASRNPRKTGSVVLQNLISAGFRGELYPVNLEADVILGKKVYASIEAIQGPVDLAVITLPPDAVIEEIKKCGRKRVAFAYVLSGGFSEEGRTEFQSRLAETGREAKVRLLGPNTTGLIHPENGLVATLELMLPIRKGSVTFISQTGMFGGFILSRIISSENFGVCKVIGLGNKVDMTEVEFMEYLLHDEKTEVVSCYLEGVEVESLAPVVRRLSARKPVIILRPDRTREGLESMKFHTGFAAGSSRDFSEMCKDCGLIRASSFEDLLDLTRAFALLPLPASNRVAILSNTGGAFVSASDDLASNGLMTAKLSPNTILKLKKISPAWHRVTNPVDLAPIYFQSGIELTYETATQAVLDDENVDSVIVVVGAASPPVPSKITLFDDHTKVNKPVVVVTMGNVDYLKEIKDASKKFPVYDDVVRGVRALGALNSYKRWKEKATGMGEMHEQ